ncbi:hypothetical protein V8D89_006613 [Ganoderma adspersum]
MGSTATGLLVLFLSLPAVAALPLHNPEFSPPSFQPLPFLLTLFPFPILAALKYFYLRFRRGQSIHAVPHSLPSQPSTFYLALNPYLVGFFGFMPLSLLLSAVPHLSPSLSNPTPLNPTSPQQTPPPSSLLSLANPDLSLVPSLIMAPVLNSSYHQSSLIPPTFIRPTDHSNPISSSTTQSSSLLFHTSLNVSPTPIVPFIFLPKQRSPSPTPSIHSISPSPASLSLAVFHSPLASRIPVPKPVYTPSLRPESCAVLPRDWPTGQEIAPLDSAVLSPTNSGSLPHSSMVPNPLDPNLIPTRPLAILKSPRKSARSTPPPLGGSFPSPRPPQPISNSSPCMTSSPALSFFRSSECQDWNLTDLHDLDGRLDVDAISRALGLGLGLGLPVAASISNFDQDDSEHASSSHSGSAAETESEDASDFDPPLDGQSDSGHHLKDSGWDCREGDLATFLGISLQMHVHGQPLSVIPEETSSEMGSSVDEDDEDLPAGPDISAAEFYDEKTDVEGTLANARTASIVWDGSWREGESLARLSMGVAC